MCGGGGRAPSAPAAVPQAPSPAPLPSQAAGATTRREAARRRGATVGGTLLTGPRGLTEQVTPQQKTLLGG